MMFPWFDKNATKECRCYCCNPGPLHTTHLQSEGRKKEPLSSFLPPLLNKHMHVHAHMHTHKHTPVWFISACAINALNANLYIVLPVSMKMFSSVFQFIFYTFLKVLVFVFFFFLEWQLTDSSNQGQCAHIVLVHDNRILAIINTKRRTVGHTRKQTQTDTAQGGVCVVTVGPYTDAQTGWFLWRRFTFENDPV